MGSENGSSAVETIEAPTTAIAKGAADEFIQISTAGIMQSFGEIIERETVPALRGSAEKRKTFRDMADNDPVIGALLFATDMLARQVEWTVNPATIDSIMDYVKKAAPEQLAEVTRIYPERAKEEAQRDDPNASAAPPEPVRPRELTPAEKEAQKHADFVLSCLEDMSVTWESALSEIMTFLIFGWDAHELVYKRRLGEDPPKNPDGTDGAKSKYNDGKIGWRKFVQIAQETLWKWEIAHDGTILGLWTQDPNTFKPEFISIEKLALFRTTTNKNNPEGRSILRSSYVPYYRKKRIEEIEGIGIERDLAGLPVFYVPARILSDSATSTEKAVAAQCRKIVRMIKRDENEGLVVPNQFDDKGNKLFELSLLTTGGRRQFDTDAIVSRYDQRIAMTVLGDFILLGHERVGSYSLGSSKMDLFSVALGAWLDSIADIFNSYIIPRLMRINGLPSQLSPKLTHSKIESIDLDALGKYVSALAGVGVTFTDEASQNYLRRTGGIPEIDASQEMGA